MEVTEIHKDLELEIFLIDHETCDTTMQISYEGIYGGVQYKYSGARNEQRLLQRLFKAVLRHKSFGRYIYV